MPPKGLLTKVLAYIFKFKSPDPDCGECESTDPASRTVFSIVDGSKKKCYNCKGLGVISETPRDYPCETRYTSRQLGGLVSFLESTECPICKGNGYIKLRE